MSHDNSKAYSGYSSTDDPDSAAADEDGNNSNVSSDDGSDYDPNYDSIVPDPAPDVLGIYTGPEADAVLARSHAHWLVSVRAARVARPGAFPDNAFDLERLLVRIPALPASIPHDAICLQGHSTWTNSDVSCSLRESTESPDGLSLRSVCPVIVTISSVSSFQVWDGTPNNGVALLILGWAYILNATLAEKQNLRLRVVCSDSPDPMTTASRSTPVPVDLGYAMPEELVWWRILTAQGKTLSADDLDGRVLPWSLIVADLGGLDLFGSCDAPSSNKLPSPSQAAAYLARFCSAYDLGSQCSAALAAILCFKIHRGTESRTVSVPKPRFSSPRRIGVPSSGSSRPREFDHLSYYMTLGLAYNTLPVVLESLLWEPDVPCNHAGQWARPIRNILGPIVEAKDYELLVCEG